MEDATVRFERGAIVVSDVDPETRLLVINARSVLEAATEVLNAPGGCTLREARFASVELARSLRDTLDLLADMGVTVATADTELATPTT